MYNKGRKYFYDGPVQQFDKVVAFRWTGETYTTSPSKAKSNLTFRYKKEHGLATSAKITLPGKIEIID